MGFRIEYELTVTEYVPDSKITWSGRSATHQGGGVVSRSIELNQRGNNTIVTYEVAVDAPQLEHDPGKVEAQRKVQREVDKSLLDLKDMLESGGAFKAAQAHLPRL